MGNFFSKRKESIHIVLIGNTGNGKSSTGNMILGKNVFFTKPSANPVTTKCERSEGMVGGNKITVIDTPDFFNTENNDEQMKSEVVRALVECAEGIHAFAVVLKIGRYSRHEKNMLQQLLNELREDVWKHTVILFTFGEQLESQHIEVFVKTNSQIEEIFNKCEGRCHVIDNKHLKSPAQKRARRKKRKQLLKTIYSMVKKNDCYSNNLLKTMEEKIQEEMKKNAKQREEAKDKVHITFLRRFQETALMPLALAFHGVSSAAIETLFRGWQGFIANALGRALDYGVNCATGHLLNGSNKDVCERATSSAAAANNDDAINLMMKTQTALENAKHMLETATTLLTKK